ncbi:MAG: ribonucleoside-diphosphate reductase, adenosylcobalamin-dependent [Phycisphaerae bacterium]|nr:ribonucleoside-diphosphate reductase, adenosylcobalamin-dependent [Phycisphaerae bacterium]
MQITRRFTKPNEDVFTSVEWERRSSRITNADGSLVFEMNDAWIPKNWSQLATDIMVSKYFRKAGVPQVDETGTPIMDADGQTATGPERSAKQVIHRLAGCWRAWGEKHGYFDTPQDAQTFYDELCWMMLHQAAAPNSPQWFNTGLHWAYGISGPAQGHFVNDPSTGQAMPAQDAYSHPQPHACFIQHVDDDLVQPGGIMDLWTREARLFKYGSGTGTNFSHIRGENEPLSGGGRSSGLMSFLKIGDRAAGAIKSGGTTRRAAKMVCLDADHPDIENFVNWKVREELKVASLVEGMKHLSPAQQELAQELGLTLDYDFNGESYQTVSGQNSNNSVRLSNEFMEAVANDEPWQLINRTDGAVAREISARGLWDQICRAAWQCADPGLQFDTTINQWHTCPASGRINASNPCSEYMFLDDTACNLASINLMKFYDSTKRSFDVQGFEHAIDIWTIVLEISVLMAAFPSQSIAEKSYRYRTLGLGYANLGAMLMQAGIPYDSEESRAICGAVTSILTGRSYAMSAKMASEHGPFPGFEDNADSMLRVIRNHRRAAHGEPREAATWELLDIPPVPVNHHILTSEDRSIANSDDLSIRAMATWDEALSLGEMSGYRNAQVTVIAPTGTIGLLMDCDTTGVEPDFALTKFKKLAGGGYFKIANQSLHPALIALGYNEDETSRILNWVMGALELEVPMPDAWEGPHNTFRDFLTDKGYTADDLAEVMGQLPSVFDLAYAFTAWSMPEAVLQACGITDIEAARADMNFNGLKVLGLENNVIRELNTLVCGTQTIEGAPGLKDEHLPVFDCANTCGPNGKRFIAPDGHIRMMAAAQPFISGAISKTINLPNEADEADIASAYHLSWELGLKANALYRDGCKLSQPLNSKSDDAMLDEEEDTADLEAARDEVGESVAEAAVVMSNEPGEDVNYVERIVERIIERPMRRRLPDTRRSITHHFNVAGHEGYLTVGMYEDRTPGELFITMSKEGSTIGGLMDSLGTAISVALQYGVPVESLVTKFAHQRFEPQGMTTNREIPFAKSLVDYIFRWLGMEFIPGFREANAPKRPGASRDRETTTASRTTQIKDELQQVKEDDACSQTRSETNGSTESMPSGRRLTDDATRGIEARTGRVKTDSAHGTDSTSMSADPEKTGLPSGVVSSEDPEASTETKDGLSQATATLMGDAPPCDVCGSITVRNGTCYKCMNCGNSMGCS